MRRTPVFLVALVAATSLGWSGGVAGATLFQSDGAAYVALGLLGLLSIRGAYRCGREEPAAGGPPRRHRRR